MKNGEAEEKRGAGRGRGGPEEMDEMYRTERSRERNAGGGGGKEVEEEESGEEILRKTGERKLRGRIGIGKRMMNE